VQKEEPAPQQNSKNLLEKVKNFYFAQKAQKKSSDSTQNLVEDYPQFNKGIIQKLPNNETVISYPVYNKISYVYSDRIGYVKRYVVKLDARDSIVETKTFQMIGNKEFLGQNKDNIPAKYYQGTMPTQNFLVILSNTNNTQDTTHIKYPNLIFSTNAINRVGPCINKPEGYVIDFKTCLITYYYRDCADGQIKSTTMQSENACNFDGGSILYPSIPYLPMPPFGAGMGDDGLPIFYENPNCQNNTKPEINPYETSCQDVPLNGCNGSLNDNTCPTGDCCGEMIKKKIRFTKDFNNHPLLPCVYEKLSKIQEFNDLLETFEKSPKNRKRNLLFNISSKHLYTFIDSKISPPTSLASTVDIDVKIGTRQFSAAENQTDDGKFSQEGNVIKKPIYYAMDLVLAMFTANIRTVVRETIHEAFSEYTNGNIPFFLPLNNFINELDSNNNLVQENVGIRKKIASDLFNQKHIYFAPPDFNNDFQINANNQSIPYNLEYACMRLLLTPEYMNKMINILKEFDNNQNTDSIYKSILWHTLKHYPNEWSINISDSQKKFYVEAFETLLLDTNDRFPNNINCR
jgi:hypothetical protein